MLRDGSCSARSAACLLALDARNTGECCKGWGGSVVPGDMRYAATARPKVERPPAALIFATACASEDHVEAIGRCAASVTTPTWRRDNPSDARAVVLSS